VASPRTGGDLMRGPMPDGARHLTPDSWAGRLAARRRIHQYGGYVLSSQQWDQAAWDRKDMIILFAAGMKGTDADKNGVIDPDSVASRHGQDIITVGASENNRPASPRPGEARMARR